MNSSQQIKLGALMSYGAIAFNIIVGFLYTPWMIKQIGKSDYGLYILVTAFISYFAMDFGLGQTIARFLSKYKANNEPEKINQMLGLTSKFYLLINGLVLIALIVVYFFIENIFVELSPFEIEKFKIVYLIAGGFSLISFPFLPLDGVLIAYERFVLLKLCDIISKVGIVILMIIALLLGYKLYALVAINAVIGIVIICIKFIYLSKRTDIKIDFKFKSKELLKDLIKFSFWVSVIGIAQRLLINIAPFILGIVSGTEQIAIFSIGIIIEGYTWTLAHALNGLFLQRVAQLDMQKNNLHEVTNLMIRVGRIQLMLMGLLFIGLIVFGQEFIILWMGLGFSESYNVILFLILPGLITLSQEIAYTYLFVINELKYRAIIFVGASVLSVIISFLLAPHLGALGCAIGIFSATMMCHVIGMNFIYWKKIKLEIPRFFKECYSSLIIPFVLTLLFGFLLNYLQPDKDLLYFSCKVALLSLFYIISVWLIGLHADEKELFKSMLLKLANRLKRK
ncbi:oligosaccharide flippase family protein [Flavobacterium lindanitolerans]|uniref:lipopolysaccharide biosynthesis protein n=2 Tax=Flavobacterium lindanitolerans TaxID=428988 RepID=UPI0031B534A8